MQINWKKVIKSKTLKLNTIALIALAVQLSTGTIIDIEAQAAIIIVVNMFLRLITHEGLIKTNDQH